MTQEELAGLSARYIGAIERAKVSASVTVLGQIADALVIEPGALLQSQEGRAKPGRQRKGKRRPFST